MKVDRSKRKNEWETQKALRGRRDLVGAASGVESGGFEDHFASAEIASLLEELEELSDQLIRFPSQLLLGKYKKLVRVLLQMAVEGMRIKKELRWKRSERTLLLAVEKADSALDSLEKAILRESERVEILKLVEEIKGCLISLFL
ncbi:DUF327 family protein [Acetomicrobium sp. S15 = DSM 107314]|uniref:DUF327 family protein n=1 Tax=Acetomicrobium sp. S15 = DSM 107314 TaxID=2529858 RepID=UPI0018E0CE88|nr:DUF327 family protein [Acetomicrobium sp. S15 = DSM 107314]